MARAVITGAPAATDASIAAVRAPGERFVAGDPLRALAALSVFCFHVAIYSDHASNATSGSFGSLVQRILSGMNIGVWMFFVLSGFLLARPFARAVMGRAPLPAIKPFLRNRLRRLVPGLWALIAVTLVVQGVQHGPWWKVPAAAAFGQVYVPGGFDEQLPHAWTLDAEMFFYVCLPAMFGLVAASTRTAGVRRRALVGLAVLATVAIASLALRQALADSVEHLRIPPALLFGFVQGIGLAVLEPAIRARPGLLRRDLLCVLLGAGLLTIVAGALLSSELVVARSVAATVSSGLLVAAALGWQWSGRTTPAAIDNPALQWLGQRSYSFYLFHLLVVQQAAIGLAGSLDGKALLLGTAALGLAASLAAAELGYRFVERPFLRRREAWRTG